MTEDTNASIPAASQPVAANDRGPARLTAPNAILRLPAVRHRTGLSRATIYRKMSAGDFPRARQLSTQCVGWLESEIDSWISERLAI
ncbi:putative DNA-binding transcriptional regulator AlpA [Sphingomonas kyeonggiensis]|uniref:Putative DNA-binding transcriptional regulator AlpA n=1 Tax=Sphingomonas kyeonggiensis TaxID=1268553 RepID=A0A7W7NQ50_9SPHN|nr:AlpA family transcriptional regulator [Sphingomonas kyeonggiensis]MBB4837755.1 putative DNA-binding transcriptional regulator AlpA [Sphingomonas kyeonggiensis]